MKMSRAEREEKERKLRIKNWAQFYPEDIPCPSDRGEARRWRYVRGLHLKQTPTLIVEQSKYVKAMSERRKASMTSAHVGHGMDESALRKPHQPND
jgi:hypothetical protein